jgi:quercetin dioxygenase-like cupin family protein
MMKGFHALSSLPLEQVTEHYSRRVLFGEKEMIVWASMKAGAHAAAHRHPQEQMFWILSGRVDFRLDEERRSCGPGGLITVPGNVEHEMWCPEDPGASAAFEHERCLLDGCASVGTTVSRSPASSTSPASAARPAGA